MRWAWRWMAGRRDGQTVAQFARAVAPSLHHRLGNSVEAAELLGAAIAWARTDREDLLPELELCLAEVETSHGDLDAAELRLRRLADRADVGSLNEAARLALTAVLCARGRRSAARELRTAVIEALRSAAATTGCAQTELRLAWALLAHAEDQRRLGEAGAAETTLTESRALFERRGADAGVAAVLAAMAAIHLGRGEPLEAARCAGESLELAERMAAVPVSRARFD